MRQGQSRKPRQRRPRWDIFDYLWIPAYVGGAIGGGFVIGPAAAALHAYPEGVVALGMIATIGSFAAGVAWASFEPKTDPPRLAFYLICAAVFIGIAAWWNLGFYISACMAICFSLGAMGRHALGN